MNLTNAKPVISANSRYADNVIITLDVNSTSRQVILPDTPEVTTFTFTNHVCTGAETIDGLAYQFIGDATQWWRIADINPQIVDWRSLTPGTVLRIPVVS